MKATSSVLDPILAEPDPGLRLDALTAYLARLDGQKARAREARTAAVAELKAQGQTWRALSHRTGLAEFTLRSLVSKAAQS